MTETVKNVDNSIGSRDAASFSLTINGQKYSVNNHIINGRKLCQLIHKDPKDTVVYQVLATHEMEQLRPDETTDLIETGIERFLTFDTDRIFRFQLDQHGMEWGASIINARTLKKIADVDAERYEIVQEIKGQPDLLIEDHTMIDLSAKGVEVFKTRIKLISVSYNHHLIEIEAGTYTTEELIGVFSVTDGYVLDLIIECEFIELKPGHELKVKQGMTFVSHAPKGSSS